MNKLLAAVLISSMIVSGFAVTCTTANTAFHSTYDVSSATGSNCVAAATGCSAWYSDIAGGTPTASAIIADCTFCATGYTDSSAGTANTATATTTGCVYCATGKIATSVLATGVLASSVSTCVATAQTTVACDTGYSDNSNGVATASGTALAGTCKYCSAAYSDLAPVSGANTAATAAGATAACKYCAPNYYWDRPSGLASAACISKTWSSTNKCNVAYSDNAPASATTNTAATGSGTLNGDCKYCALTYWWSKPSGLSGAVCATAACATGYSDVAPVSGTNTAATVAGAVANCMYCAPNYFWDRPSGVTGAICISKNNVAGATCATGYSDVAPTSGTNAAATAVSTTLTGNCANCAVGYIATSSLATGVPASSKSMCVLAAQIAVSCDAGYADVNTGVATAVGTALATNCKFCATGYSDVAPVSSINQAATAAGAVGMCQYCALGYTQTAAGQTCTKNPAASSSSFLAVSISLLATLVMIFF